MRRVKEQEPPWDQPQRHKRHKTLAFMAIIVWPTGIRLCRRSFGCMSASASLWSTNLRLAMSSSSAWLPAPPSQAPQQGLGSTPAILTERIRIRALFWGPRRNCLPVYDGPRSGPSIPDGSSRMQPWTGSQAWPPARCSDAANCFLPPQSGARKNGPLARYSRKRTYAGSACVAVERCTCRSPP